MTADGALPDEAILQSALRQVLQDHPRLGDYELYVAGPVALAITAEFLLLEHGLPREQLFVNALEP